MATFLAVFVAMIMFTVLMSVGLLLGRKPISGSCGGMAALGMDVACDVCKGDKSLCDSETDMDDDLDNDLAYEASSK